MVGRADVDGRDYPGAVMSGSALGASGLAPAVIHPDNAVIYLLESDGGA